MKTTIATAAVVCLCCSGFSYQIIFNGIAYGNTLNLQDTLPPGVPLAVYGSARNETHQISYDPALGESDILTGGPQYGGFGNFSIAPESGNAQSGIVQVYLDYFFTHIEAYYFNNFQVTSIAYFDQGSVDIYQVDGPLGPVASVPLSLGNSSALLILDVNTDYFVQCVIDGNPAVSAWSPAVIDPSVPGYALGSTQSRWTPSSIEIIPAVPEPSGLAVCALGLILGIVKRISF
ncbi:MAG TPA: hypothetical protein VFD66_03555 [Verrucomicrobiae bacterium]|nr:hypothetical protein [Verrucomicrobiae bacterium]